MSEQFVTYELEGDVAMVGIDRAQKRNAINREVMAQMHEAFIRASEEAKVGILFGHGDNFSAGLDLAEAVSNMKNRTGFNFKMRGRWSPPLELVARGGVPWIAALKGACIGGGLEIAAACHIRVADETTFFALPEAKRGIFVGGGGTVRIQRLMGYARMADLMLTGRALSAHEGERANLCQYVTPPGKSIEKAKELAALIASNSESTNWGICAALPRVNDMSHEDGLFFESLIGYGARSPEGQDRISQFLSGQNKVVAPEKGE